MRFAVKDRREEAGISQEELSEKSGVSVETIEELEANTVDIFNTRDMTNIALALGISVETLFFEEEV